MDKFKYSQLTAQNDTIRTLHMWRLWWIQHYWKLEFFYKLNTFYYWKP